MSVNLELPTADGLKKLAPNKHRKNILTPMRQIQQGIRQGRNEVAIYRHAPDFVPAGQSTQMIVGATPESDYQIMAVAQGLYDNFELKRVFYSAYVSINEDKELPALHTGTPLLREHRLYQADWLMRFYQFKVEEIVDETHPDLDLEVDPKLSWALRHPEQFPVDVNRAEYERILRVPGIGVKSARLIVCSRRFGRLTSFDLKKMGCVMKRAQYFITCGELEAKGVNELYPERVRSLLVQSKSRKKQNDGQLTLLFKEEPA